MPDLIVAEFVTLDGVMEAPGGEPTHPHTNWAADYVGPQHMQYKLDEMLEAGTLLVGRVTYESFAGAWPHYEGPLADRMNAMPKLVASTTLRDPEWNNTTVIEGDVPTAVAEHKRGDGGPIVVHGSRTLAHSLMAAGLVDELRLMVIPVLLGSGQRLFPESPDKTVLELAHCEAHDTGVIVQHHRVVRS